MKAKEWKEVGEEGREESYRNVQRGWGLGLECYTIIHQILTTDTECIYVQSVFRAKALMFVCLFVSNCCHT